MMAIHTNKPTFSIYRADGTKTPTLRKSFIIQQRISWGDVAIGALYLEDGTEWRLVVEPKVADMLHKDETVYCIVSYQVHNTDDGQENYAIARLYTPKRQTND